MLHLGTEITNQGLHGCRSQAELTSNVRLQPVFDEEGAKHLVTPLEGLGGFEERAAAGFVVHSRFSKSRVGLFAFYPVMAMTARTVRPEASIAKSRKQPGKARGREKRQTHVRIWMDRFQAGLGEKSPCLASQTPPISQETAEFGT
jgi:hypothetical protein